MSDIGRRVAKLSAAKRRILSRQLAKKRGQGSPEPITPQPRDSGPLPLSFSQERLWFLTQLEPESRAYHLYYVLRFDGNLGVTTLERSFQEVIRRHEGLRTTFVPVDGKPVQVINGVRPFSLPVVALEGLPRAARQAELRRLARAESDGSFDLARGPLLRGLLLRLAPAETVLLLTLHHIIFDGWSLGLLVEEVSAVYRALTRGQASPLPALEIHYADYALWQRRWLQGEVLESQLAYWRRQLAGAPPRLRLPTDRPRSLRRGIRGALRTLRFAPALDAALKELSSAEGCTLFVTLLAAFTTLLARYSGQSDVVVASPIANRHRTEVEHLIGFLLNTLVLRVDLSGDPDFLRLLERVRKVALEAFAHQDLPFAKLVEELQPERSLGRAPLFQVLFVVQNFPRGVMELPGLRIEPLESEVRTENFDLTIWLEEQEGRLVGRLKYSVELFDSTTIRRLLKHFNILLQEIVADPRQPLSGLSIISPAERQQLLLEWNDTRTAGDFDRTVVELFEIQAERTPEAIAVEGAGERLSYRELERRSRQLAVHLRDLGVGPETLVGLLVERSLETVIGMLGILRAAAVLMPLDPAYPKARLAAMLETSRLPVLLTQEHLRSQLPDTAAKVIFSKGWQGQTT
ncbi:MAG: AMP-binding protein, partial [bacterium]|nr:AMP-binding protein [bacterium]